MSAAAAVLDGFDTMLMNTSSPIRCVQSGGGSGVSMSDFERVETERVDRAEREEDPVTDETEGSDSDSESSEDEEDQEDETTPSENSTISERNEMLSQRRG